MKCHNIIIADDQHPMSYCTDCCYYILPQVEKNNVFVRLHSLGHLNAHNMSDWLSKTIIVNHINEHCCCNPQQINSDKWILIDKGNKDKAVSGGPFTVIVYNVDTYQCGLCGWRLGEQICEKPQRDIIRRFLLERMAQHEQECLHRATYSYS